MTAAIQCEACGFTYSYADEGIEYIGVTCPWCKAPAQRVAVPTPSVPHERVPALLDALDVQLALWIAQSMTEV